MICGFYGVFCQSGSCVSLGFFDGSLFPIPFLPDGVTSTASYRSRILSLALLMSTKACSPRTRLIAISLAAPASATNYKCVPATPASKKHPIHGPPPNEGLDEGVHQALALIHKTCAWLVVHPAAYREEVGCSRSLLSEFKCLIQILISN